MKVKQLLISIKWLNNVQNSFRCKKKTPVELLIANYREIFKIYWEGYVLRSIFE